MKDAIEKLVSILNDLDETDTPKEKLPDCPRCEEDELGVIHPELVFCYNCGWELRTTGGKVEVRTRTV